MTIQRTISTIVAGAVLAFTVAGASLAMADEAAIARGGRLYDRWFGENKAAKPETNHPAYANKAGKYDKDTSWRCKECHGWDYLGADGAYAKGAHFTGIKGIKAAAGKDPKAIAQTLRAAPHGYTEAMLSAKDVDDLAQFVSKGQVDLARYVDAATGKPRGDGARGETYFTTLCAGCHGTDGKKLKDGPSLGSVAGNAYEMMHKILNGQPGEAMPALRALDHQIAADLAVHLQTLPE